MRRPLLAALCLLCAIGFVALGVWQIERRTWKLDLIAKVDTRLHAAPEPLNSFADWRGDQAYRRVRMTGIFRNDRETLVKALTELGAGWWVMTPLRTPAGTVLVNRGFVPPERRDAQARSAGLLSGPVTITGLIRSDEPRGAFLRSNDPSAERWYSRDVAAIAKAKGLGPVAPFFVDADATPNPGGYPVGGLTVVAFPNNHLIYALTWFGLAGLSLAGAALSLRSSAAR